MDKYRILKRYDVVSNTWYYFLQQETIKKRWFKKDRKEWDFVGYGYGYYFMCIKTADPVKANAWSSFYNANIYQEDPLTKVLFSESVLPAMATSEALADEAKNKPKDAHLPFTEDEEMCMKAIVNAWNIYAKIPVIHPSAEADFLFHIHGLQDILMGRVCARDYPDYFVNKSKESNK